MQSLLISNEVIRNHKAIAKSYWKNFTILQIKSHSQNHFVKLSTIFIFTQQVLFLQDYMVHPKFIGLRKSLIYHLLGLLSSIYSYNYNLTSYLCELLTPFIPTAHCKKDSFTLKIFKGFRVRRSRLWFHTMLLQSFYQYTHK